MEEGEEHVRQPPHLYIKRCKLKKKKKEENIKNGGKIINAIYGLKTDKCEEMAHRCGGRGGRDSEVA